MEEGPENPLFTYIKDLFKVDAIEKVKPFINFPISAHETSREVSLSVELSGSGILTLPPNLKYQPRSPYKGLIYNLDDVSVRTLYIRYVKAETDLKVCKIYNPISDQASFLEVKKIFAALGSQDIPSLQAKAGTEGPQNTYLVSESTECMYLQDAFVRTCMQIDKTNIMNGIIRIPDQVADAARLPKVGIVFDQMRQSYEQPVEYYVLVPRKHILAWCLNIGDHLRKFKGWHAFDIALKDQDTRYSKILYFVVGNRTFEGLRDQCIRNFLTDKIDRRPLGSVGIKNVGTGTVNLSLTYVCFPHIDQNLKASFKPVVSKTFPKYADILSAEFEMARRIEEEKKDMIRINKS